MIILRKNFSEDGKKAGEALMAGGGAMTGIGAGTWIMGKTMKNNKGSQEMAKKLGTTVEKLSKNAKNTGKGVAAAGLVATGAGAILRRKHNKKKDDNPKN